MAQQIPQGFREVNEKEIITDYYWGKPQEVILNNPDAQEFKWRLIRDLYLWLPSNYLSSSGVTYYVNADESDDSIKIIEAIPNPYETGMPKTVDVFVRKDLEYYIIVYSATPGHEFNEPVLRKSYYLIHVKNGKIVKKGYVEGGA